uniref:Uncharacterized protein n=1 Tax=Fagus sylvatica TaxID=28930 RepID=A0A2N9IE23_FAGSY
MARTQSRSRASKLARLVNSEASMTRFRELYRVPPSIRLAYCNLNDFPVINKDEILLPIMAVVEGGVRFPLHPLLVNFLQIVNATPSQVSVNLFRIIMGVVALNRLLGVNLRTGEILRVYQYMCPGEESRTLCHLKAKNVHQKLVNGLPDTNKGYDKDYLRVSGDWFTESKCRSSFGYLDPSRIALYEGQADTELVKRVLATNIYVDQRGEPCSAPLLLRYEPQIRSFLEADTTALSEDPELIPTGQVSEMAPPINPFELMGKATGGSSSESSQRKGPSPKNSHDHCQLSMRSTNPITERIWPLQERREEVRVLQSQLKGLLPVLKPGCPTCCSGMGRSLSMIQSWTKRRQSSQLTLPMVWPELLVCPEDMNQWDSMNSGQIFRHVTRGMMMATQGILSMESRVVKMTQELQKKGADYKKLEDQHFINVNLMKEAKERARTEVENRKRAEVELTELKENVRKLESECLASLGKAREEGKEEGKAKGKILGHESAMEEARTQFRMVYNTGFRRGWKSALTKTEQPETSELFLCLNTPIPYPEEGLKDSDNEAQEEEGEEEEEEEDDGGEEGEEGTGPDRMQEVPQPAPTEKATDAPGPSSGL